MNYCAICGQVTQPGDGHGHGGGGGGRSGFGAGIGGSGGGHGYGVVRVIVQDLSPKEFITEVLKLRAMGGPEDSLHRAMWALAQRLQADGEVNER